MEIATETERKYDVPAGFELPQLTGAGPAVTHELDATYYDTDDLRLTRNRRTLRRRSGGSDAGWHLKTPGDKTPGDKTPGDKTPGDGVSRTEHRLPLDGDDVPEELCAEVRAIVRDRPLRPVARLRTTRVETPLLDADGRTLALIAQDAVTAETDGHEQRWQEVEVELVDGDAKLFKSVQKALFAAGATPASGPSKVARALGDRLPAAAPKTKARVNPVLAYAEQQRDALAAYDPGVRHGDPEAVHKMRVATRRLRSTLKTFKRSFDPDRAAPMAGDLRWLAHLLGEVRDGQVLSHKLLADVQREGPEFASVAARIKGYLDTKVERGRQALEKELDGERYLKLLDAVDALVDSATGEDDPLRRARRALAKADGLLDRARTDGVDAELHEARKSYKRARYAVEVFETSADKPAARLTKSLTALQDVLGDHQDSVVAREILKDLAGEAHAAGENGFAYGILHARQEQVGWNTLGDLPAAVEASRKRKLRSWLG
jgi:CHAD domain-containing protein